LRDGSTAIMKALPARYNGSCLAVSLLSFSRPRKSWSGPPGIGRSPVIVVALSIPQTTASRKLPNYYSSGKCLLPVNLPFFLIFFSEHYGRGGYSGIPSYQIGKRVPS
jgi:hypothetical protein